MIHEMNWKKHPKINDILISDEGDILSYKSGKWKELKKCDNGKGYLRVGVGHSNPLYIHRLVAESYLYNDDPLNKKEINHIDGNKKNNNINNLEWCTRSDNEKHAHKIGLKESKKCPIVIIETGEIFNSQRECAKAINGDQRNISMCINGKRNRHKGYHFKSLLKEVS